MSTMHLALFCGHATLCYKSGIYGHRVVLVTIAKNNRKNMIIDALQELGLAKNEARIYETLLREGECGVSTISTKSEVNRRNVYDSINRLIEKGLVFEVRTALENRYHAVEPAKLTELIEEKQRALSTVLPEMGKLYYGTPRKEEVFVYRGIEGWKNYLRDMLRIGEDNYTIG